MSCADDWKTEKTATFLTTVPDGWSEIDDGWVAIAARPVRDFSGDPDQRVEELKAWSIEQVDKLVACIPDYAEAPIDTANVETEDEKEDA